jgi:hypothetical protein
MHVTYGTSHIQNIYKSGLSELDTYNHRDRLSHSIRSSVAQGHHRCLGYLQP